MSSQSSPGDRGTTPYEDWPDYTFISPPRSVTIDGRKWVVGGSLGKGGHGRVYSVTSHDSPGEVHEAAIKVIRNEPGAETEAQIAMRASRIPGVYSLIGVARTDQLIILLMPRADSSLRDVLDKIGSFESAEALKILTSLARTIERLSEDRIVHGDLKPENILRYQGEWLIADFGTSRHPDIQTRTVAFRGATTPPYAAPELWRYERPTELSDIYALGVIAYELLSGRMPFPGPDYADYAHQHLNDSIPPLEGAMPLVSGAVELCLAKTVGNRITARGLSGALYSIERLPDVSNGLSSIRHAVLSEIRKRELHINAGVATAIARDQQRLAAFLAEGQLNLIRNQLFRIILDAYPEIDSDVTSDGTQRLRLGEAQMSIKRIEYPKDAISIRSHQVLAVSQIAVGRRPSSPDQEFSGRSHSLWYSNWVVPSKFEWHEVAFYDANVEISAKSYGASAGFHQKMYNPQALSLAELGAISQTDPEGARLKVAWPPTQLSPYDLSLFLNRWVRWFALSAAGSLTRETDRIVPSPGMLSDVTNGPYFVEEPVALSTGLPQQNLGPRHRRPESIRSQNETYAGRHRFREDSKKWFLARWLGARK